MMWLLYVIVVSGVVSAVLRYYLSQPSSGGLPEELIDMPIDAAVGQLGVQAAEVLAGCEQMALRNAKVAEGVGSGVATLVPVAVTPRVRVEALRELYGRSIGPYLSPAGESGILANHMRAVQMFRRCRTLVSQEFIAPLAELERICDTCRGLRSRQKLGLWVDRLMLIHVPLSTALIVLGAIHAIGSLRY